MEVTEIVRRIYRQYDYRIYKYTQRILKEL